MWLKRTHVHKQKFYRKHHHTCTCKCAHKSNCSVFQWGKTCEIRVYTDFRNRYCGVCDVYTYRYHRGEKGTYQKCLRSLGLVICRPPPGGAQAAANVKSVVCCKTKWSQFSWQPNNGVAPTPNSTCGMLRVHTLQKDIIDLLNSYYKISSWSSK